MNKEIITTGKTIDDAVAAAVAELGVPSKENIEYTVIDEPKKGLFGIGATPAKISAKAVFKGELFALDFINQLVKDMGLDVNVEMKDVEGSDKDCKLIDISGEGAGALIGHHGDTLDSIQYLANLAANKRVNGVKPDYVKITVDAENYRAKRENTLRELARRMADKVLKQKRSVMLEPMNPYERRIIHSEIQNIEGVSTNSIGSENNRKIVIYLEEK
ncbi:MAG: protein jag [Clostridia bacterium]|nr:protein jag [Clostridia bacterium]